MIVPALICIVTNIRIYLHVCASSGRVQTRSVARASNQQTISRRDIFLLRHMVIMFSIFIFGWAPWLIVYIVEYYTTISVLLDTIPFVSNQSALLLDVIDLFLYNHEVRKYLIGLCRLPCCRS